MEKQKTWLAILVLNPLFAGIGVVYRIHKANRERLGQLLQQRWIAVLGRIFVLAVLLLWFAIWFFTPDQDRKDLTAIFREFLGGFGAAPK